MEEVKIRKNPKKQGLIIFLCWMAYTVAYFGRYSYNSCITKIEEFYGVTHAESGMVVTFFFFAYGVGQAVHGLLCKFYKKRQIIFGVLVASSLINLAVFFGAPFYIIKYLWLINGATQSVLWSSLIMIISRSLDEKHKKKAVLAMSTTVPAGTALVYGVGAIFVSVDAYVYIFLFSAIIMTACAVVWFVFYKNEYATEETEEKNTIEKTKKSGLTKSLIVFLTINAVFAVFVNFLKDGIQTWSPSILKEVFSISDEVSIALTVILPCLGVFGAVTALWLHEKIKNFGLETCIMFSAVTLLIFVITMLMKTDLWVLFVIVFGVIMLIMNGINNLITSMVPLSLENNADTGAIAGILNCCCYAGSTISSYALGVVADTYGWHGVFDLFFICSVAVTVTATLFAAISAIAKKKTKIIK